MTCSKCGNPVKARGLCNAHYLEYRKANPAQVKLVVGNRRYEEGDTCSKGHIIAGENIKYRYKDNGTYVECARCRKANNDRRNNRKKERRAEKKHPSESQPVVESGAIREESTTLAKSVGIDIRSLTIKPRALTAWNSFQDALKEDTTRNCYERESEFIDYEVAPDTALCNDCPLFDLCSEFSRKEVPGWGLWAGRIFGDMEEE